MDTLTVCFKPACRAYAFCMRVLCFMCQTHLFAQMLSESTNIQRTFCLSSVHPHAHLLQTEIQTHKNTQRGIWTCNHSHTSVDQKFKLLTLTHLYGGFFFQRLNRKKVGFGISESLFCVLTLLWNPWVLEFECNLNYDVQTNIYLFKMSPAFSGLIIAGQSANGDSIILLTINKRPKAVHTKYINPTISGLSIDYFENCHFKRARKPVIHFTFYKIPIFKSFVLQSFLNWLSYPSNWRWTV